MPAGHIWQQPGGPLLLLCPGVPAGRKNKVASRKNKVRPRRHKVRPCFYKVRPCFPAARRPTCHLIFRPDCMASSHIIVIFAMQIMARRRVVRPTTQLHYRRRNNLSAIINVQDMTNLFNTLKNALGGSADKRAGLHQKSAALARLRVCDHGAYISCELAADNTLRYKSQIVLRPNGDDPTISLIYTIYGKRISHDEPFREPGGAGCHKGLRVSDKSGLPDV